MYDHDLLMQLTGQRTQVPCAVDLTRLRSRVQSSVWAGTPSTKELFLIILTHMMNREIIPSRKKGFDSVRYNMYH